MNPPNLTFHFDLNFKIDQLYCTMLQTADIEQFYRLAGIWIICQMVAIGVNIIHVSRMIFLAMILKRRF